MENKKGEATLLLDQIKNISEDIFNVLMDIDDSLAKLEQEIKLNEEVDKSTLTGLIRNIRQKIGAIEGEDTQEIKEEEILQSLLKKLDSLVDQVINY